LRLSGAAAGNPFGRQFNQIIDERRGESDAFYQAMTSARVGENEANDAAGIGRDAMGASSISFTTRTDGS